MPDFVAVDPPVREEHGDVLWSTGHNVLTRVTHASTKYGGPYDTRHGGKMTDRYEGTTTVSIVDPALATAGGTVRFEIDWPEASVAVESRLAGREHADEYVVDIELDAFESGDLVAERRWSTPIPPQPRLRRRVRRSDGGCVAGDAVDQHRDRRRCTRGGCPVARPRHFGTAGSGDGTGIPRGCASGRAPHREDLLVEPVVLGNHRQQRLGVRMLRGGEDLLGGADLDDPSEVHHGDAVGDVPRQAEVVRDDEDRHAAVTRQAQQQLQDLAAHRSVERRDRFVGNEQARLQHHRPGDHDTLALTAGQLVGKAMEELLGRAQAGVRQRLRHARLFAVASRWIRSPSATIS